jgi:hypothetical protein
MAHLDRDGACRFEVSGVFYMSMSMRALLATWLVKDDASRDVDHRFG